MKTKVCKTCAVPKDIGEFRKAPTVFGGDGYSKDCTPCIDERKLRRAMKLVQKHNDGPGTAEVRPTQNYEERLQAMRADLKHMATECIKYDEPECAMSLLKTHEVLCESMNTLSGHGNHEWVFNPPPVEIAEAG